MSRYYEMTVDIEGFKPKNRDKIVIAACGEWEFDPGDFDLDVGSKNRMHATGRSNLWGGESEEEFVERLARIIWKANGAYCSVEVRATYLEDLPCQIYTYGRCEYDEYKESENAVH